MPLTRPEIVEAASCIVGEYGLGDLTMRRLAGELGVQPSALYWHVANKQALLALLAEEILTQVPRPSPRRRWDNRISDLAHGLRSTLLAHRDGAEIVAASRATTLEDSTVGTLVVQTVTDAGQSARDAEAARDALLHFVIGFVLDEQTHASMVSLGAAIPRPDTDDAAFGRALEVVVRGIRTA